MKNIFRFLLYAAFIFVISSITIVFINKFINPIISFHMIERAIEGNGLDVRWRDYEEISPNFFRAVIAAEDARFFTHKGVDWRAVKDAQRYNKAKKGKKKRGASTITMQTAKNVYLNHSRTYIRKAFEVWFTYLTEIFWGKKRILEVYANIVETGPGIYGVEAASQKFFNKPAAKLSKREAALIAAVLPNPIRWSPGKPTAYINRRASKIQARMNSISLRKIERDKS